MMHLVWAWGVIDLFSFSLVWLVWCCVVFSVVYTSFV